MALYSSGRVVFLLFCLWYPVRGEDSVTLFEQGMEEQKEQLECTALFRDPIPPKFVIGDYLSNHKLLSCESTISSELKDIFEKDAQTRRDNLVSSLSSLCGGFIDVISILALNWTNVICANDTNWLSTESIEGKDFCTRNVSKSGQAANITLKKMKLPSIVAELDKLLTLHGKDDCSKKCGTGDGNVLCNSFFSLAVLLSHQKSQNDTSIIKGRYVC